MAVITSTAIDKMVEMVSGEAMDTVKSIEGQNYTGFVLERCVEINDGDGGSSVQIISSPEDALLVIGNAYEGTLTSIYAKAESGESHVVADFQRHSKALAAFEELNEMIEG